MGDGRNTRALFLPDLEHLHHEGNVVIDQEPIRHRVAQHRRSERPERLPQLDLGVEELTHVGAARITENGPVSERPGAELHPTLEPPDHLSLGDRARDLATEPGFLIDVLDRASELLETRPLTVE